MKVSVTGTGMTPFGELWNESVESLARTAVSEALEEAQCGIGDIELLVVGNMLLQQLEGRAHVGQVVSQAIGYQGPSTHVEAACASGGLAVRQGLFAVRSGLAKRVLVVGVEKMTDAGSGEITRALMAAGSEDEQMAGATFPSLYALMMLEYMETYGVSEQEIAASAVKNHLHGSFNPLAQFQNVISVKNVMRSPLVCDPIRQLMCSPVSDGAAAVVLESGDGNVEIVGSGHGGDTLSLAARKSRVSMRATRDAAAQAFGEAGVSIEDVNLAELHDCFSIAEVVAVEDLGWAKFGKGAALLSKGFGRLLGDGVVINSSGGLKACGHPVGATGVKQLVEVTRQLLQKCGKRQVQHARVGLTHNVGGTGATAVVHILRRTDE